MGEFVHDMGVHAFRQEGRIPAVIDKAGCQGAAGHAIKLTGFRTLAKGQSACSICFHHTACSITAGAGQNDNHGVLPEDPGCGRHEDVDGQVDHAR